MPLSPDEAYYWTWSRALAPGYLDHPPMVALWAWFGTALAGDTALGVRLLAPVSAALGSVLLADAGRRLFPGQGAGMDAGLRAAVLLNATLMLGAGAVTMTPDTPLLFFWTLALWALARLVAGGGQGWWLAAGAAAGLAFDSKYTAALLAPAAALLLLAAPRGWRRPAPWLAALLAVAMTAPVLLWNAGHGWASLLKQGGRVGDWTPTVRFMLELLAGQAGLATPGLFLLFVLGTARAVRRWREPGCLLLAALVVPGALVFVQHALGDRVQANWVAVLYPGCALAAAGLAPRGWRPAAALGFGLTALVYLQASLAPLPLPRSLDPTLRLAGWPGLAAALVVAAREGEAGFIASEEYGTGALLAWSVAGALPVLGADPRWRWVELPRLAPSGTGLLLVSDRRREPPDPAMWQSAQPAGHLVRGRGGLEAEGYRLYRVVPRADRRFARLPEPRTRDAASDAR